jgi:hypothetical protein
LRANYFLINGSHAAEQQRRKNTFFAAHERVKVARERERERERERARSLALPPTGSGQKSLTNKGRRLKGKLLH